MDGTILLTRYDTGAQLTYNILATDLINYIVFYSVDLTNNQAKIGIYSRYKRLKDNSLIKKFVNFGNTGSSIDNFCLKLSVQSVDDGKHNNLQTTVPNNTTTTKTIESPKNVLPKTMTINSLDVDQYDLKQLSNVLYRVFGSDWVGYRFDKTVNITNNDTDNTLASDLKEIIENVDNVIISAKTSIKVINTSLEILKYESNVLIKFINENTNNTIIDVYTKNDKQNISLISIVNRTLDKIDEIYRLNQSFSNNHNNNNKYNIHTKPSVTDTNSEPANQTPVDELTKFLDRVFKFNSNDIGYNYLDTVNITGTQLQDFTDKIQLVMGLTFTPESTLKSVDPRYLVTRDINNNNNNGLTEKIEIKFFRYEPTGHVIIKYVNLSNNDTLVDVYQTSNDTKPDETLQSIVKRTEQRLDTIFKLQPIDANISSNHNNNNNNDSEILVMKTDANTDLTTITSIMTTNSNKKIHKTTDQTKIQNQTNDDSDDDDDKDNLLIYHLPKKIVVNTDMTITIDEPTHQTPEDQTTSSDITDDNNNNDKLEKKIVTKMNPITKLPIKMTTNDEIVSETDNETESPITLASDEQLETTEPETEPSITTTTPTNDELSETDITTEPAITPSNDELSDNLPIVTTASHQTTTTIVDQILDNDDKDVILLKTSETDPNKDNDKDSMTETTTVGLVTDPNTTKPTTTVSSITTTTTINKTKTTLTTSKSSDKLPNITTNKLDINQFVSTTTTTTSTDDDNNDDEIQTKSLKETDSKTEPPITTTTTSDKLSKTRPKTKPPITTPNTKLQETKPITEPSITTTTPNDKLQKTDTKPEPPITPSTDELLETDITTEPSITPSNDELSDNLPIVTTTSHQTTTTTIVDQIIDDNDKDVILLKATETDPNNDNMTETTVDLATDPNSTKPTTTLSSSTTTKITTDKTKTTLSNSKSSDKLPNITTNKLDINRIVSTTTTTTTTTTDDDNNDDEIHTKSLNETDIKTEPPITTTSDKLLNTKFKTEPSITTPNDKLQKTNFKTQSSTTTTTTTTSNNKLQTTDPKPEPPITPTTDELSETDITTEPSITPSNDELSDNLPIVMTTSHKTTTVDQIIDNNDKDDILLKVSETDINNITETSTTKPTDQLPVDQVLTTTYNSVGNGLIKSKAIYPGSTTITTTISSKPVAANSQTTEDSSNLYTHYHSSSSSSGSIGDKNKTITTTKLNINQIVSTTTTTTTTDDHNSDSESDIKLLKETDPKTSETMTTIGGEETVDVLANGTTRRQTPIDQIITKASPVVDEDSMTETTVNLVTDLTTKQTTTLSSSSSSTTTTKITTNKSKTTLTTSKSSDKLSNITTNKLDINRIVGTTTTTTTTITATDDHISDSEIDIKLLKETDPKTSETMTTIGGEEMVDILANLTTHQTPVDQTTESDNETKETETADPFASSESAVNSMATESSSSNLPTAHLTDNDVNADMTSSSSSSSTATDIIEESSPTDPKTQTTTNEEHVRSETTITTDSQTTTTSVDQTTSDHNNNNRDDNNNNNKIIQTNFTPEIDPNINNNNNTKPSIIMMTTNNTNKLLDTTTPHQTVLYKRPTITTTTSSTNTITTTTTGRRQHYNDNKVLDILTIKPKITTKQQSILYKIAATTSTTTTTTDDHNSDSEIDIKLLKETDPKTSETMTTIGSEETVDILANLTTRHQTPVDQTTDNNVGDSLIESTKAPEADGDDNITSSQLPAVNSLSVKVSSNLPNHHLMANKVNNTDMTSSSSSSSTTTTTTNYKQLAANSIPLIKTTTHQSPVVDPITQASHVVDNNDKDMILLKASETDPNNNNDKDSITETTTIVELITDPNSTKPTTTLSSSSSTTTTTNKSKTTLTTSKLSDKLPNITTNKLDINRIVSTTTTTTTTTGYHNSDGEIETKSLKEETDPKTEPPITITPTTSDELSETTDRITETPNPDHSSELPAVNSLLTVTTNIPDHHLTDNEVNNTDMTSLSSITTTNYKQLADTIPIIMATTHQSPVIDPITIASPVVDEDSMTDLTIGLVTDPTIKPTTILSTTTTKTTLTASKSSDKLSNITTNKLDINRTVSTTTITTITDDHNNDSEIDIKLLKETDPKFSETTTIGGEETVEVLSNQTTHQSLVDEIIVTNNTTTSTTINTTGDHNSDSEIDIKLLKETDPIISVSMTTNGGEETVDVLSNVTTLQSPTVDQTTDHSVGDSLIETKAPEAINTDNTSSEPPVLSNIPTHQLTEYEVNNTYMTTHSSSLLSTITANYEQLADTIPSIETPTTTTSQSPVVDPMTNTQVVDEDSMTEMTTVELVTDPNSTKPIITVSSSTTTNKTMTTLTTSKSSDKLPNITTNKLDINRFVSTTTTTTGDHNSDGEIETKSLKKTDIKTEPPITTPNNTKLQEIKPKTEPLITTTNTKLLETKPITEPLITISNTKIQEIKPKTEPLITIPNTKIQEIKPKIEPLITTPITKPLETKPKTEPLITTPNTKLQETKPITEPLKTIPNTIIQEIKPKTEPLKTIPNTIIQEIKPKTEPLKTIPNTIIQEIKPKTEPLITIPNSTKLLETKPITEPPIIPTTGQLSDKLPIVTTHQSTTTTTAIAQQVLNKKLKAKDRVDILLKSSLTDPDNDNDNITETSTTKSTDQLPVDQEFTITGNSGGNSFIKTTKAPVSKTNHTSKPAANSKLMANTIPIAKTTKINHLPLDPIIKAQDKYNMTEIMKKLATNPKTTTKSTKISSTTSSPLPPPTTTTTMITTKLNTIPTIISKSSDKLSNITTNKLDINRNNLKQLIQLLNRITDSGRIGYNFVETISISGSQISQVNTKLQFYLNLNFTDHMIDSRYMVTTDRNKIYGQLEMEILKTNNLLIIKFTKYKDKTIIADVYSKADKQFDSLLSITQRIMKNLDLNYNLVSMVKQKDSNQSTTKQNS